ncbi:hypothetical protein EON66_08915 [archaeon]|nr:MAG: hypothetical protein EON66_08915 [archaeon]
MCAGSVEIFRGHPTAFSLLQPTTPSTAKIINLIGTQGAKTVAFIADDVRYTRDPCFVEQERLNVQRVGQFGSNNVTLIPVTTNEAVKRAVIDSFWAYATVQKPDIVYICCDFVQAVAIVRRARELQVNVNAMVTRNVIVDPRLENETDLLDSGVLDRGSWIPIREYDKPLAIDDECLTLSPIGCVDGFMLDQWAQQYTGRAATSSTAEQFGALQVLSQAIEAAGSVDIPAVVIQLESVYFSTVFGLSVYGRVSHMVARETYVRQLLGGTYKIVAPPSAAQAVIVYPRPTWQYSDCTRTHGCNGHGACQNDGSCACDFGWTGRQCSAQWGIPVLIVGIILALLLFTRGLMSALANARVKRELHAAHWRGQT